MTSPRLNCARADMRRGAVIETLSEDPASQLLAELAATLPELLGSLESDSLERIATQLDPQSGSNGFAEVLLLSQSYVHVVQPLPSRPGEALLANAPAGRSVGLVLSQVHARAAELEREP